LYLKGKHHFEDMDVDGRIILKYAVKKQVPWKRWSE
jgi:hypothetical protein